jgi:hypothetical protein
MKKVLVSLFFMLSLCSNAQMDKSMCEKIESVAANGALIFKYNDKLYLVSLEDYFLKDIYTGNIHLIDMSHKRKTKTKEGYPRHQWDLFLMNRKLKYTILK